MTFQPSPQQRTIFDFVTSDTRSLIVEARAGSGKTTTLVEIAKLLPTDRSCVFLAFNKNIATELQARLPLNVQAKTFHSHCFNALQRNLPKRPKVDENKVRYILQDSLSKSDFFRYGKFVTRLIGYAKNAGVGTSILPDEPDSWYSLIAHYNLVLDTDGDDEEAVELAAHALDKSSNETWRIDFDDMLYLALRNNISFDKCNYVMLDEAQDTNGVQRTLLKRMLAPTQLCSLCNGTPFKRDNGGVLQPCINCNGFGRFCGRLIAVGDSFQSIYGFRGADSDAMEQLTTEFQCETLPLSVSYRCSKAVVREAQRCLG